MTKPWRRGALTQSPPHECLSTPGASPTASRSLRAYGALLFLAFLAFTGCAPQEPARVQAPEPDPEARTLQWLAGRQTEAGAFPTEGYLPREIGTVLVMGLLATGNADLVDLDGLLDRSVRYVESLQSRDGAFRFARWPDIRISTSLAVLSLIACKSRSGDGPLDVVDPRLLARYARQSLDRDRGWDEFLEEDHGEAAQPTDPEELLVAARKAKAGRNSAEALRLRGLVLDGQGPDGAWATDGPSEGRRIVGAAVRLRTLALLQS